MTTNQNKDWVERTIEAFIAKSPQPALTQVQIENFLKLARCSGIKIREFKSAEIEKIKKALLTRENTQTPQELNPD
jgi:hypothetical protein